MNNETIISDAKPCCYCCLSETNLVEHNNGKGLVYWLCSDCNDAGFQFIADLALLVCPIHGIQHHLDVDNVEYAQRFAKKKKYWYDCPVKTRNAKENGKPPTFLLKYDEIERNI